MRSEIWFLNLQTAPFRASGRCRSCCRCWLQWERDKLSSSRLATAKPNRRWPIFTIRIADVVAKHQITAHYTVALFVDSGQLFPFEVTARECFTLTIRLTSSSAGIEQKWPGTSAERMNIIGLGNMGPAPEIHVDRSEAGNFRSTVFSLIFWSVACWTFERYPIWKCSPIYGSCTQLAFRWYIFRCTCWVLGEVGFGSLH